MRKVWILAVVCIPGCGNAAGAGATLDVQTTSDAGLTDAPADSADSGPTCAGNAPSVCCTGGFAQVAMVCEDKGWGCPAGAVVPVAGCPGAPCAEFCGGPELGWGPETDASDTSEADAADDATVTGAQVGDPCNGSFPACATGLVCCYPCGIPGCQDKCAVPCTGAGCNGGCPMLP